MSNEDNLDDSNSPYPQMARKFELHFNQSWRDKDWSRETQVWAASWKACAAIKDAEIETIKHQSAVWRCPQCPDTKLQEEIAARDLMIKELREELVDCAEVAGSISNSTYNKAREALAKSEHHNSRALEKMLLEARIDELKQLHSFTEATNGATSNDLLRYIKNAKAKLAELNE